MADTLYIIGNGFDLHHGLKTSYLDFRDDYVKKRNPQMWNNLLDIYGDAPKQDDFWWKDFENMLGKVDYAHLEEDYYKLAPARVQNLLKNQLPPLFGYWINGIDTNAKMDESLGINQDSMFFTFNYTLLLEKTYQVKEENVWHIHGSVKHPDDIIVGHDADAGQLVKYTQEYNKDQPRISPSYADYINQEALNGAKKVRSRIYLQEDKFYQYCNIKHFIAMGFSFNDIDMPYIEKIWSVNEHKKDTKWTLYVHTPEDESIIKKLIDMGVSEHNINTKNW